MIHDFILDYHMGVMIDVNVRLINCDKITIPKHFSHLLERLVQSVQVDKEDSCSRCTRNTNEDWAEFPFDIGKTQ
jgi:hypothetical protein